jgi:hypothetical protein
MPDCSSTVGSSRIEGGSDPEIDDLIIESDKHYDDFEFQLKNIEVISTHDFNGVAKRRDHRIERRDSPHLRARWWIVSVWLDLM